MPKIAFLGFPRGRVRVNVAQEDATAEATIDLLDETGELEPPTSPEPEPEPEPVPEPEDPTLLAPPKGASVQLSSTRTAGTAPAGFFFSANAAGFGVEDHYFDVRYKWEFGDPGYYTRHDTEDLPWGKYYNVDGTVILVEDGSVPQGKSVRFLGNDKNVAYGPHVSHVFEKPGSYTVTCEVRKRGHAPLRQTMKVTVKDPAAEFPGTDTVCVSSSGNFDGAPAGALLVRSYAEAREAIRSGPKKRVLFRRGEAMGEPSARTDRDPSRTEGFDNLQFGAFGTGAPPTYNNAVRLDVNAGGESSAWGLDFVGPYHADDPWKTNHYGKEAFYLSPNGFKTIWDCGARGGKNLITIGLDAENIVIGNFHGTDYQNYGAFANRNLGYFGMCGVWIKQNPNAVIGPGKFEDAPPYYQDHAPFRCSALGNPVCFNLCDLRSIGSWAGYYQPCLRIGRSPAGTGPLIEEAVMERIRTENGGFLSTGNSGSQAYPRRYLWDKCYTVVLAQGDPLFAPGVSGPHYRNVVAVIARVPKLSGNTLWWLLRSSSDAVDTPEIKQLGVTLMGCTMVDLRPTHPMTFATDTMSAYGFVRIENNIVHTPNKDDATSTHDEPLDLTQMWELIYPGLRYETNPLDTRYATVGTGWAAWYKPLPESKAYKSASGPYIPVDDFFGRIRGEKTSRGAFD